MMMTEYKLGDMIEYKSTTCIIMFFNNEYIGIDYKEDGCSVESNSDELKEYEELKKMGFKDEDPLYWVDESDIKMISKLEDYN